MPSLHEKEKTSLMDTEKKLLNREIIIQLQDDDEKSQKIKREEEIEKAKEEQEQAIILGRSKIHEVAAAKDYEELQKMIDANEYIDMRDNNGETALTIFIKSDQHKHVDEDQRFFESLRKHSNIHKIDAHKKNPLIWLAIKSKYSQIDKEYLTVVLKEDNEISEDEDRYLRDLDLTTKVITNDLMTKKSKMLDYRLFQTHMNSTDKFNIEIVKTLLLHTCKEGLLNSTKELVDRLLVNQENKSHLKIDMEELKHRTIPKMLIELFKYLHFSLMFNIEEAILCYKTVMKVDPNINYTFYPEGSQKEKASKFKFWKWGSADEARHPELCFLIAEAMKYGVTPIVTDLLSRGASIVNFKDSEIPGAEKYAREMEMRFNSCIKYKKTAVPRQQITYDFSSLLPPPTKDEEFGYEHCSDFNDCECRSIWYFRESKALKSLLAHPLIDSYLDMKWEHVRWLFYLNTLVLIFFGISLTSFGINVFQYKNSKDWVMFTFITTTSIMLIRECYQLLCRGYKYFCDIENIIVPAILAISFYLLLHFQDPHKRRLIKQLCMINYLLTGTELLLTLAQLPYLSKYVAMFRKVTWNFFRSLSFYLIMIVTFSLCFILLFLQRGMTSRTVFQAFFNTTMLIPGQMDISNLNFEKYPYTSHIIFIVFVFLVTVIMFNLLNALSVSDAHTLNLRAPIWENAAKVDFIYSFEQALSSKRLSIFTAGIKLIVQSIIRLMCVRIPLRVEEVKINLYTVNVKDRTITSKNVKRGSLKYSIIEKSMNLIDEVDRHVISSIFTKYRH